MRNNTWCLVVGVFAWTAVAFGCGGCASGGDDEIDGGADSGADSDVDADTDGDADGDSDTDSDIDSGADSGGDADSDTDSDSDAEEDAQDVALDKAALDVGYAPGDSATSVTQVLTLASSGANGTAITWSSGNTELIGDDGTVIRGSTLADSDAPVTMTATIAKGAAHDTKSFDLTVLRYLWVQDAYLKASNARTNTEFGETVAISGDSIIVGASREGSNQTTITNTDGSASSDNSNPSSGAVYVFKKDGSGNWVQDAYLKASNSEMADNFGCSVAISGDTIVVGAYLEDSNATAVDNTDGSGSADNSASGSGAVYVFKKNGSGDWIQDAYLKASNASAGDNFGYSVAISGDTIVVGARQEDSNATAVTNTDSTASADNSATDSGAVYVFKKDGSGNWIQDAYLKASNAAAGDFFGETVSISGNVIAVGVPWEDSNQTTVDNTDSSASANDSAPSSGAAYVFKKDGSGDWIQDAYLKAPNPDANDSFGMAVSLSGGTVLVGASAESSSQASVSNANGTASADNSAAGSGAVYVFKKDGLGNWIEDAYLKASNAGADDQFWMGATSGGTVVSGARLEDSNQTTITNTDGSTSADNSASDSGAVYVFMAK